MLEFQNTEIAFRAKSDKDLRKTIFMYNMVKHPIMVKLGKTFLPLAFKLRLPIEGLIRNTVYEIFCGGESIEACAGTINHLAEYGVETILDYSVEGKAKEEDFDACCKSVIDSIRFAAEKSEHIPFAVFKPTGVGRFGLWEKMNVKMELNSYEQEEWERVVQRFRDIADAAKATGIPVLVDAEESWIQTAADELVLSLMQEYNKEEVLIYNTLQMYRHDRLEYLHALITIAKAENFKVGLKLVRGAYMEKERDRSEELGYDTPIQATKADTDRDYNAAIKICLDNLDVVSIVAGTHNESSSRLLFQLMEEKGIDRADKRIYFSQLLGMSDNISYNLASEGLNVVKYVPFGPVKDVMPYLLRRAEENTSVGGQTGRELSMLQQELRRRKEVNN